MNSSAQVSEFQAVVSDSQWNDRLFLFLKNIFHLFPEDKFHQLIKDACKLHATDEAIYKHILANLATIKPFLSELTYALPALKIQKKEMAREALQLLAGKKSVDGYVEIGSTGRYISELRKHISVTDPICIINDIAPSNAIGDIFERSQFAPIGHFLPLTYQALPTKDIPDASIDLITCYIGLHHSPPELTDAFAHSLNRVLRPGGLFIMRDHNATTAPMSTFCSLIHTVFNVGLKVSWEVNAAEVRHFKSADEWSKIVCAQGFKDAGPRLFQDNDPSDNALMAFIKS
jgi:SAM-dependent methyltransferase